MKEMFKDIIIGDVHSPPEIRVIGSLRNSKQFQDVFSCKPGDNMYDEDICVIW